MHLCIFSNRTNGQLLNQCINTSAYANVDYLPQVLIKIACKWLRTHFLFPVFLLVRDVLRVLLIVSCTGRDIRTLQTQGEKQSYFCAPGHRASLSLHFPHNIVWLKQAKDSKYKLQRNKKRKVSWTLLQLLPAGTGKESASIQKWNKGFIIVWFPYQTKLPHNTLGFCTINVKVIVSFWRIPSQLHELDFNYFIFSGRHKFCLVPW